MGMTDRQFDAFIDQMKGNLETIAEELEEKDVKSKKLEELIKKMEAQLKRP